MKSEWVRISLILVVVVVVVVDDDDDDDDRLAIQNIYVPSKRCNHSL
jgi:hypothetical protein